MTDTIWRNIGFLPNCIVSSKGIYYINYKKLTRLLLLGIRCKATLARNNPADQWLNLIWDYSQQISSVVSIKAVE